MTALERAARAQYEAWIDDVRDLEPSWDELPESHKCRLVGSARAVLMAVRDRDDLPYAAKVNWQNRVDDILSEEG